MKTIMSLFIVLVLQLLSVLTLTTCASFSMPNCIDRCGHVKIPYPFGISANCYHDSSYEIICNSSFNPSKPFLRHLNLEVLNINWPGRYSRRDSRYLDNVGFDHILTVVLPPPNLCGGKVFHSPDLKGSPFIFSRSNVLMMKGCGGSAVLKSRNGKIMAGCASVCASDNAANISETPCYGVGCCQASLYPDGGGPPYGRYVARNDNLDFYEIAVDFEQLMKSNSCNTSVAVIDSFAGSLSSLETFPTALQWRATFVSDAPYDKVVNVSCGHFTCNCPFSYEGNPYLPYGCQVVEECRNCQDSRCEMQFYSSTESGPRYYYCTKHLLLRQPSFLGFIIGMGVVLLILGSYWLYRYVKRRKEIKQKAKHFKRNGGLLLQQQMSSDEGVVETTQVFTVTELQKATDNFNENRILGQGG